MSKKALVLLDSGIPRSWNEVEKYLYGIFSHEKALLPLLQSTKAIFKARWLADKNRRQLGTDDLHYDVENPYIALKKSLVEYDVSISKEYTFYTATEFLEPTLNDVISAVLHDGNSEVTLLPLYPTHSYDIRSNFITQWERYDYQCLPCLLTSPYSIYDDYYSALNRGITAVLEKILKTEKQENIHLVFHSPTILRTGNDKTLYERDMEYVVSEVMKLRDDNLWYHLAYGGNYGDDFSWAHPNLHTVIQKLVLEQKQKVITVPLHPFTQRYETVVTMMILESKIRNNLGEDYLFCIDSICKDELFIQLLFDLITNASLS